jgi:hypothetical protein
MRLLSAMVASLAPLGASGAASRGSWNVDSSRNGVQMRASRTNVVDGDAIKVGIVLVALQDEGTHVILHRSYLGGGSRWLINAWQLACLEDIAVGSCLGDFLAASEIATIWFRVLQVDGLLDELPCLGCLCLCRTF